MVEDTKDAEEQSNQENSSPDHCAGGILKKHREDLKMTQQEVASKLNLNIEYIAAIELGEYSKISSGSYVYGYIRSYAKLLNLTEQEIESLCESESGREASIVPDYMERKIAFSDESFVTKSWFLFFVVITMLLFVTWWFVR